MNIIEKTYTLNGSLTKRTKTDTIVLHHRVGDGDVEGIDRIHKGNGWTCIGYHFYVRKDGSIYRGRQEDTVGAHAYGTNSTSIGICAEGNFETDIMPEEQKQAIKEVVAYVKGKYNITKVIRHKDVNATACPGKNYPFDEIASTINVKPVQKSIDEVANAVIKGDYGNGRDRREALEKEGYDYNQVQAKVNELMAGKTVIKSVDELAREVIAGKWENGSARKKRLTAAGYDYNAVQKRVNELLK